MICPHCRVNVKYKERSNLICSKCQKIFAFEPKTHPLLLHDVLFKKIVNKLSKNNTLYFTPQQLQFAVSRKKIKNSLSTFWLIIPAIITSIIAGIIYFPAAIIVILFWIVLIIFLAIRAKKYISLPQDFTHFNLFVLDRWKEIYGKYPDKLILKDTIFDKFDFELNGILICQESEIATCLTVNHATKNLAIITNYNLLNDLLRQHTTLPVFVLHDASSDGHQFYEKIKQRFSNQTKVFDIGLRPQTVLKSNLIKFRDKGKVNNFKHLTAEENIWLNDGYYTPLFTLRPEKLIQYVTKQIENRAKVVTTENIEEKAKSIGFMTWANEK